MISIFNANFTKESPVEYMMKESDRAFVNQKTLAPIFYLNSRELQTITQTVMFSAEELEQKDPLGKAEKSWLARFHAAKKKQRKRGSMAEHVILKWRDLLWIPQYLEIFPFFEAIICSDSLSKCSEKLALSFPNKLIESLLNEVESEGLFEQTKTVIDVFVANNRKMQEASQEAQPKLREYLAQEYSMFLTLASLDALERIKTAFDNANVQMPVSISEHNPVQALLTYPISASKDKGGLAEKSFALFLTLQKLYCRYADGLNLPALNRPLLVVDTFVSEAQTKKKELLSTLDATSSATQSRSITPPTVKTTIILPSSREKSSLASLASMYQPSNYEVTATKILHALNSKNHADAGVDELEIYRNGVLCTLKLISLAPQNNVKLSTEKSVLAMISDSVKEVVETNELGFKLRLKFHYDGFLYQLTIELTEVKLAHAASSSTGKRN